MNLESANALRAEAALPGACIARLARKYGVSWTHAKGIAVGERVTGHRRFRVSDETVAEAKLMMADGEEPTFVAEKCGVSSSAARRYRNGSRRRNVGIGEANG